VALVLCEADGEPSFDLHVGAVCGCGFDLCDSSVQRDELILMKALQLNELLKSLSILLEDESSYA
jgi:hypothetical protein